MDTAVWEVSNLRGESMRKNLHVSTVQNGEVCKKRKVSKQEQGRSIGELARINRYGRFYCSVWPFLKLRKLDRFLQKDEG